MKSFSLLATLLLAVTAVSACGDDGGAAADGGILRDGDGSIIDGDGSVIPPPIEFPDGGPIGGGADCTPTSPQCNNCMDDDGDGQIDGNDIECVSPLDNDESSFATGIPGDNKDAKKQDCFFDGDSGAGNDGCDIDSCCFLDSCEATGNGACELSDKCINNCGAITPPGCDCFGCCTLCDGDGCYDIIINPALAPECDGDLISDPTKCPTCTKVESCGPPDCSNPDDCILCPGQDPSTLPAECGGQNECPNGQTTCTGNSDCLNSEYCSQGCCNTGYVIE